MEIAIARRASVWLLVCAGWSGVGDGRRRRRAAQVVRHVVVYGEKGRFAGWPANHGIWSWGDEILVGFSRGYDKDRGPFHHIDKEKPEEFLLARSRDGGATWSVEQPRPPGALVGTPGMRHGTMPPGVSRSSPPISSDPIDFSSPRLRHDRPHGEHERRHVALLFLVRPRPSPGEARTACRSSARKGSWAAPTSS